MANWRDVATSALRQLGVVAQDEFPEASMASGAKGVLELILADLNGPWGGCTLTFGIDDTIPAAYQTPLAWMVAGRLAAIYERTPPVGETTALMRIRAVNNPYVRDMDFDENGTTTEGEICAFDRGAYF